MNNKDLAPESLMMGYGYDPQLSEGAVKCPIFQTSTFAFKKAEDGKAFFEIAKGSRKLEEGEHMGLIYSRINNPDLEILEDRLALWDKAEMAAVFESGMSAITTTLFEFLSPGDVLVHSSPLYGGTDHFVKHVLQRFNIQSYELHAGEEYGQLKERLEQDGLAHKVAMVLLETPANPTNTLFDIAATVGLAKKLGNGEKQVLVAVDNTYLGPLWCHPLELGADLVLYSATKYIGGHSDVIAGAVLGSKPLLARVKKLRTYLGSMAGPWTGWLLMRSLETLKLRMERQAASAAILAKFLSGHPKVEKVYYLGFLSPQTDASQYDIFVRQYHSPGAMLSFDVRGGEAGAFAFLNNLKLAHLAVSLGSTESLAQHPYSMTHAGVAEEDKDRLGLTPSMVRYSVGVEHPDDLIWDLEQALAFVPG
ncbi:MAG: cystathionine gamma-synthase family protein [Bacteroidetes bacterium]|nr:cystathionine gamma-synthase family protein [Bacteroidota bacterium]